MEELITGAAGRQDAPDLNVFRLPTGPNSVCSFTHFLSYHLVAVSLDLSESLFLVHLVIKDCV